MSSGIRKQKKKFERPLRLFEKERIDSENEFKKKYGLKNKREIWKMNFAIKNIRNLAKGLITAPKDEQEAFISRLAKKGLIKASSEIDDVLGMNVEKYAERRLQSIVFRKGLAHTPKEARQMIVHRKVIVGERIINIPSYFVNLEEEKLVKLAPKKVKAQKEAVEIKAEAKEAAK